jgi:hypothetical protein
MISKNTTSIIGVILNPISFDRAYTGVFIMVLLYG